MEYQKDLMGMDLSPAEKIDPIYDLARDSVIIRPDNGTVCGCGTPCGQGSWGLNGHPLAMVYASCQSFQGMYDLETALSRGTLFAELDLPLETGGCGCGDRQRRG